MRILLVEEAAPAKLTRGEIHRAAIPCVVQVADSAAAFREALHEFSPDVILFSDAAQLDVAQSLRMAESLTPNIPFIVITATGDDQTVMDYVRAGAVDFVRKQQLAGVGPALLRALGLRHAREENAREEMALRTREERFRHLAENLPGVLYLRRNDEHYSMLYVNDAVETLTGYRKVAFLDNTITFASLCHPEDSSVCDTQIDMAVANRAPFHLVYRLRHRSGSWRWVEEHGVGVYSDGRLEYVEGFLTDITERRRVERRLERQKRRAEVTLASIGDAVITTDDSGRIKFMNAAAERLTGWSRMEALGRPLTSLVRTLGHGQMPAENPIVRCMREDRVVAVADEAVIVNRTGHELAINGSVAPLRYRNGTSAGVVMVLRDVTQPRAMAKQMAHEATHDRVTGLINRQEFERRLERALMSARTELTNHTICYLDVDQFKLVNDTEGHLAGDALLRQLGQALGVGMRARDTVARLGGDEFGILLERCSPEQAQRVAADVLRAVREFRFDWNGQAYSLWVSIGVAPISPTSESLTAVLRDADAACYLAKSRGGNCVHIFRADDHHVAPQRPSRRLPLSNLTSTAHSH